MRTCLGLARWLFLLALLLALAPAPRAGAQLVPSGPGHVDVLRVAGPLDTWVGQYIDRGLRVAEGDGAQAALILLDTPGGDLNAMQRITTRLLNTRLPVIVYVYPSGAWAASAGTFVVMAANIAAMAPGTSIGAAHPVGPAGADIPADERVKTTNFAASLIQSIAQERGRNADWATRAVTESLAATAAEALDLGVIDVVASSVDELLSAIDGRTVQTAAGAVTLHSRQASLIDVNMNLGELLFHTLVNPDIALILLQIGLLAIVVEIYNPGAIVPAVVGVLCVLLSLVALGNLPVNWGGILLLVVAMVLFVIDIKVNSVVVTMGSIAAFVLGALLLFSPLSVPTPYMPAVRVSPVVIAGLAAVMLALVSVGIGGVLRSRSYPVLTGPEAVLGATGRAVTDLAPDGQVQVRGEVWSAQARGEALRRGEAVRVVGIEGLRLQVVREDRET